MRGLNSELKTNNHSLPLTPYSQTTYRHTKSDHLQTHTVRSSTDTQTDHLQTHTARQPTDTHIVRSSTDTQTDHLQTHTDRSSTDTHRHIIYRHTQRDHLQQRFPIPVLVPPRSAYFVCISYHVRRLFYSNASALRSGHHRIFCHDSSSKRVYIPYKGH